MVKIITKLFAVMICVSFIACSGKESAKSIAQKWCDLNGKVARSTTDEERRLARASREEFEKEMEAKHKGDEALMKEVRKEVEKCENASEGK